MAFNSSVGKKVVIVITVFLLCAELSVPVLSANPLPYESGKAVVPGAYISVSNLPGNSVNTSGRFVAKTPGFVKNTLVLYNNNLLPGNVQYTENGSLNPGFMALDPLNGLIYITDKSADNLTVLNTSTNTVQGSIYLGSNSSSITFNPVDDLLYIITGNRNITVVSPSQGKTVGTVSPGGTYLQAIATDTDSGDVYVCDFGKSPSLYSSKNGSTVYVIDHTTLNVSANITVPSNAYGIAYDPMNHHMYVTSVNNLYVTSINTRTNTISAYISNVPGNPGNLVWPGPIMYNPSTGSMIVECLWDGTTVSINTTSNHVTQIPDQVMGQQSAYDPVNGYIYALYDPVIPGMLGGVQQFNSGDGNIVSHYYLGIEPTGIVYDAQNSLIYVSNQQSGSVSIIQTVGPNNVTFRENGLPTGTQWELTYGQTTVFLNETPTVLNLPNGDFNFTIHTPPGYTMFQEKSGHIVLTGGNVTVSFTFMADPYLFALVSVPVAVVIAAVFLFLVRKRKD